MTCDTSNTKLSAARIPLLLAVMLAFGVMAYSNTFESPFVFDDEFFIINDAAVHMTELSGNAVKTAAFDGKPRHRFLPNISFALNYYFGRLNPFGYHLVNLVIHLLSGIFLFFLVKNTLASTRCRRGCGVDPGPDREGVNPSPATDKTMIRAGDDKSNPDIIAFFAALIWIVQPVATQSVTYVCQRMASMVALFYILSLLLYVKGRMAMAGPDKPGPDHPNPKHAKKEFTPARNTDNDHNKFLVPILYFSGCVISAVCAVATKENAGTLPMVILLYEWFFFQDLKLNWSCRQIPWIAFFTIGFASLVFWYMGENPLNRLLGSYRFRDFSLIERVMTEWRIVVYYIGLFFWAPPGRLNLDHDYPLSLLPAHPATTMLALAAILSLFVWAAYAVKKDRLAAFAIFWFFITQATESTVIGIELVFEHRTYIPFMLISLLFVLVILRMIKNKPLAYGLLTATALVFSVWTYQRNQTWQDPIVFLTDSAAKSPNKYRPQYNLGVALYDTGDVSGAVIQYKIAIQKDPDRAAAHNNLGSALLKLGKTHEAIQSFHRALDLKPDFADAHNNLGNALFKQGQTNDAIYSFRRALALNPDLADAHNNLGNAFLEQGKIDKALQGFHRALALDPDHIEARNNLANTLMQNGDFRGAINHFQAILKKHPDHIEANINMGTALAQLGLIDAAITHYKAALRRAPNNPEVHNNVGVLLAQEKMFSEAIEHFQRALTLRPGYTSAINNMRQLEQMMK